MRFAAKDIEGKAEDLDVRGKTIYVFYSDINEKKD
jgi:hypothetical protein